MTKKTGQLAKLTRPSATGLMARERLLTMLNQARAGKCVWIMAPAGAGKTSLVNTWLERTDGAAAWLQLDESDSDPAAFFHYLSLLAAATVDQSISLPVITPESLPGMAAFAQRYFAEFFGLFPAPFTLVLDNYHEVAAHALVHQAMVSALQSLPPSMLLVCISREPPPAALSRCCIDHDFLRIGWEDLRLTDTEAGELAQLTGTDQARGVALNTRALGWAAGLRLLLQASRAGVDVENAEVDSRRLLFNYFATEVFNRNHPEGQVLLLQTCLLPSVSAEQAQQLSGQIRAGELLDELYQQRLFLDRRIHAHDRWSYEYHMLFKEFLIRRAREQFSEHELYDLTLRSAALLEQDGRDDAAVSLYAAAADWQSLQRMVERRAPELIAHGRYAGLREWLSLLPVQIRHASAWLSYWQGMAHIAGDALHAREFLKNAWQLFKEEEHVEGQLMACAAIIDTYNDDGADYQPVLRWADELIHLWPNTKHLSEAVAVQVIARVQAVMAADPAHQLLALCAERAQTLMTSISPQQRIWLTPLLILRALWFGNHDAAAEIISEINRGLSPETTPKPLLMVWRMLEGTYFLHIAQRQPAVLKLQESIALGEQIGFHVRAFQTWSMLTYTALSFGDVAEAERCLAGVETLVAPQRSMHLAQHAYQKAGVLWMRGDLVRALRAAQSAVRIHGEAGTPFLQAVSRLGLAHIHIDSGAGSVARIEITSVMTFARTMQSTLLQQHALLLEAWSWLAEAKLNEMLGPLQQSLRLACEQDYQFICYWWRDETMSRIFAAALRFGIEVEFVRKMIRNRRLVPLDAVVEHWPWPVRIQTLSVFRVWVDDRPLTFTTKVQKKPLELLKALTALGGAPVSEQRLLTELWPDAEGDAAVNSLNLAVHRLRKLIGEHAVVRRDGQVMLDRRHCWVDVYALQDALVALAQGCASVARLREIAPALERIWNLYVGRFLESEAQLALTLGYQRRLHAQVLNRVMLAGKVLLENRRYDEAEACYRHGIEQEPFVEGFYLGLMKICLALDERAEVIRIYTQCRTMFVEQLGIEPSQELRTVFQKATSVL